MKTSNDDPTSFRKNSFLTTELTEMLLTASARCRAPSSPILFDVRFIWASVSLKHLRALERTHFSKRHSPSYSWKHQRDIQHPRHLFGLCSDPNWWVSDWKYYDLSNKLVSHVETYWFVLEGITQMSNTCVTDFARSEIQLGQYLIEDATACRMNSFVRA